MVWWSDEQCMAIIKDEILVEDGMKLWKKCVEIVEITVSKKSCGPKGSTSYEVGILR